MDKTKHRLFFLSPDESEPFGGIKKIYQQVDILNKNGWKAFVVHNRKNFRCSWFKNQTAIAYPLWPWRTRLEFASTDFKKQFRKSWDSPRYPKGLSLKYQDTILPTINSNDVVIVPEIAYTSLFKELADQPFMIFNQNAYMTFPQEPLNGFSTLNLDHSYRSNYLIGMIVVSQNSLDYINYALPDLEVRRIRISVDANQFNFSPHKLKQIAYMPRKCPYDVHQLISLLLIRGNLKD